MVEELKNDLLKDLRDYHKRLKYWIVGVGVANIAFAQLLRYLLETYF